MLHNIPNGISGFHVKIISADSSVALVGDAEIPDFGPIMSITPLPNDEGIEVATFDANRIIDGPTVSGEIFSFAVTLVGEGQTTLTAEIMALDDDMGNDISGIETIDASVVVGP